MRRLVVIAVMFVMAGLAAPASAADPGVSVSIDRITYVSKTNVEVAVAVRCPRPRVTANRHVLFDYPLVQVSIVESVGTRIAAGEAWIDFDGATLCDGSVHTITASAMVDPYTRSFKPGRAMASAWIDVSYYWWNEVTGRGGYVEQWSESPWAPIRIQR